MKHKETSAPIRSWAKERLSEEIQRSLKRLARSDDVRHIALMPDIHLSRDVCVGTAFATSHLIYPDAVGGDIGCGMAAVALDATRDDFEPQQAGELQSALRSVVPIHRQRTEVAESLASHVPSPEQLSVESLRSLAQTEGCYQIGTLGTGNHFLELQYDQDDGRLWLMVHSGSRGLGQAIRAAHLENAVRSRSGLLYLDITLPAGAAYLQDMLWARRFAAASRRVMLDAAARALQDRFGWHMSADSRIDCDHNHINQEAHFGSEMLIHRKGAMAAWPDQPGIVPGSMAAPSFHVVGRGLPESLCSSAHGAGRALSRSESRTRISRNRLAQELQGVHVDPRQLSGLIEESPSAYKDIHAVMNAQRKLVRIRRTLQPILTHKGVGK